MKVEHFINTERNREPHGPLGVNFATLLNRYYISGYLAKGMRDQIPDGRKQFLIFCSETHEGKFTPIYFMQYITLVCPVICAWRVFVRSKLSKDRLRISQCTGDVCCKVRKQIQRLSFDIRSDFPKETRASRRSTMRNFSVSSEQKV